MIFPSLAFAPLVWGRKAAPEFMVLFRSAALRFQSKGQALPYDHGIADQYDSSVTRESMAFF